MIERYSLACDSKELKDRFSLEEEPTFRPVYQAVPGKLMPVITHSAPLGCSYFHWGLIPRTGIEKGVAERVINVPQELIPDKPVIKRSLTKRRCLVPADGFYCWKKVGKKLRTPWRFVPLEGNIISFAGIWEEFEEHETNWHTFQILTMPCEDQSITDRIPLILSAENEKIWMRKESTEADLLKLIQETIIPEFNKFPVSHRLNAIDFDHPSLLNPAPSADQHGNLTLFD